MSTSILYAKVFGLYFILITICLLLGCKNLKQRLAAITANSDALLILGFFELLLGSFIIVTHNKWVFGWQVIITLIGWLMILEAIMALVCPAGLVKYYKKMTTGKHFCVLGTVCLVLGLILIAAAFFNFKFCIQL